MASELADEERVALQYRDAAHHIDYRMVVGPADDAHDDELVVVYQRRKPGTHWTTFAQNYAIRADVAIDGEPVEVDDGE